MEATLIENSVNIQGEKLSIYVHLATDTSHFSKNISSANPTKWSNTLKQFVGNLPTTCLSVFDHFVGLALKGLNG